MDYVKGLLWGLVLCVVISLLCGCKTKQVAVPEVHYRDSVRLVWRTDSVWLHDSVYVSVKTKGDTTYLTKCVTKYKTRDRIVRDTAMVVRRDTVTQVFTQTLAEEKSHTRWELLLMRMGGASMTLMLVFIVVLLFKSKT